MALSVQTLRQNRWLVALCVSLCVHFALLGALEGPPDARVPSTGSTLERRAVRFRLLQDAPNVSKKRSEASRLPVSVSSPGAQVEEPQKPETIESPETPAPESADLPAESKTPTLLAEAPYYAPKDLTSRPTLVSEGNAPAPTHIPDIYPLPVLVYLYINETGAVDNVVLGESFLSDTAKKFIQDTFAAMTFTPGMLGTYPVKSRLTLEVKLDAILSPH